MSVLFKFFKGKSVPEENKSLTANPEMRIWIIKNCKDHILGITELPELSIVTREFVACFHNSVSLTERCGCFLIGES